MGHEAKVQAILRERNRRRTAMVVWLVLLIGWVLVIGLVVAGWVNDVEGFTDGPLSKWIYAVPAAVLAIGTYVSWRRWKATDTALVAEERQTYS